MSINVFLKCSADKVVGVLTLHQLTLCICAYSQPTDNYSQVL